MGKLVTKFLKNCPVEAVPGLQVTRVPSAAFLSQTSGSDGLGLTAIDTQSRWIARPLFPTLERFKSSPSLFRSNRFAVVFEVLQSLQLV